MYIGDEAPAVHKIVSLDDQVFSVIPTKAGIQRVSATGWIALRASLRARVSAPLRPE
jgi:hypothetical protein